MPGPQSAVGRNPTALFHLRADFHRISMRVQRPTRHGGSHSPHRIRRVFFVFLRISVFAYAYGAQPRAYRPGLPGWRAQKASVTLSFRRPSGRRNGRQSSYKQNAEDGVRLNEKRRTMERGDPRGTGCARAGRHARAGRAAHVVEPAPHDVARVGRHRILAVRPGIAWRFLGVPSRMSLSRRFPVPDSWPVVAFAPILSHISRCFILTTLRSRTVTGVVRRFQADRRDVCRARGAYGFSRENECRHRNAR